eukprot:973794-Heterocapsa_arctica.AAC.1
MELPKEDDPMWKVSEFLLARAWKRNRFPWPADFHLLWCASVARCASVADLTERAACNHAVPAQR